MTGMLADAPSEGESGEAVAEFISSASGAAETDAASAAAKLFAALRAGGFGSVAAAAAAAPQAEEPAGEFTKRLEKKVVIATQDKPVGFGDDDGNTSANGTKYSGRVRLKSSVLYLWWPF